MKPGAAFTHDRGPNWKHEWLTPPAIIAALGPFDLDPCAPPPDRRPWPTASTHLTADDDGLIHPWHGRVWCNPPYETNLCRAFIQRLASHGNGIALVFARVETALWLAAAPPPHHQPTAMTCPATCSCGCGGCRGLEIRHE